MRKILSLSVALPALLAAPSTALAGKYDVNLTSLGSLTSTGTVQQDGTAFRSLSSELAVLSAPKPVDPADSLGLSGFALSADVSLNTISGGETFWEQTTNSPDNLVPTIQVMGRKGLWPGIEVGGGATHVFDSRMWTLGGYAKIALHEGFHHTPIPSIAVRGHFGQLLGSKDLRMTTVGADVVISHVFGAGSTLSITPYVGYQALMAWSRSGVLDATPDTDEYVDPDPSLSNEFVFKRQDVILRHRPFFGLRMVFGVMRFGLDGMIVPGGSTESTDNGQTSEDTSGLQQQYTVSIGADF